MRQCVIFSLVFLVLCSLLTSCEKPPARLQESGLNSRFMFSNDVPFDEYVDRTRQMIAKARVDLNEANRDVILNANAPFELKPDESKYVRNSNGRYEKGVLFIHGLIESPYQMKALARHFQALGFLVRSILLPGHGTVPGDLLQIRYQEWVKATQYGLHRMKRDAENLYICGFSTGGALAVSEALNDPSIKGLILFSPALAINSPWAFASPYLKFFANWFGGEREDLDYAKYESFSIHAIAEVYQLTHVIDAAFSSGKRLAMPVFIAASVDDMVVDTNKTIHDFQSFVTSARSDLLLYGRWDDAKGKNGSERISYQNSYLPEERIAGFSHQSLFIPPDDPHYGKNGDYKSCLHYQGDREKRMICLNDPNVWQGEITEENLKNVILRRLTWNPRYDDMIREMDLFLDGVKNKNPM
jgi:esterase/lipase